MSELLFLFLTIHAFMILWVGVIILGGVARRLRRRWLVIRIALHHNCRRESCGSCYVPYCAICTTPTCRVRDRLDARLHELDNPQSPARVVRR